MAKSGRHVSSWPRSLRDFSRTRRARLVAEFESDLGVDHHARALAAARARRWQRIKTVVVWTIALILFGIACYKLWLMGQNVTRPFSDLDPIGDLLPR